jgi:DNA-binding MarR family transcriptional regulator
VRTQAALSEIIGADKTRIISTLDRLQAAGLISRSPDPTDRRVRLLSITDEGRDVLGSVRRRIRTAEDRLLAALPPAERSSFRDALNILSGAESDQGARPATASDGGESG